jgi:glyoxylase-like metal-dependent hydrolase (beta-lactamase superfamily II)
MNATRGLVVPAGGGKHLDMAAPGRFAALKLLGHETNESVMLFQETVPAGTKVAFPASAKVLRAAAQQQDVDEMGLTWVSNFAARSPEIAVLLKDVTFRKPAQVFKREMVLDLGGVRVRIMRLGPGHARGDTVMFVEED